MTNVWLCDLCSAETCTRKQICYLEWKYYDQLSAFSNWITPWKQGGRGSIPVWVSPLKWWGKGWGGYRLERWGLADLTEKFNQEKKSSFCQLCEILMLGSCLTDLSLHLFKYIIENSILIIRAWWLSPFQGFFFFSIRKSFLSSKLLVVWVLFASESWLLIFFF